MENWFSLIVFSVYNYLYNIAKDLPLNKQSVILAGPSGCGKTETYRCLKRYFKKEIPKLVVDLVDMNQITCEGFSGNNTEFLVQGLKRGRSKGIGILFGDEFDKRISPIYSSHGDNVNREIQGQLLLPIEGCIIDNVDTSKTLFICMGSFNEIRENTSSISDFLNAKSHNISRAYKINVFDNYIFIDIDNKMTEYAEALKETIRHHCYYFQYKNMVLI